MVWAQLLIIRESGFNHDLHISLSLLEIGNEIRLFAWEDRSVMGFSVLSLWSTMVFSSFFLAWWFEGCFHAWLSLVGWVVGICLPFVGVPGCVGVALFSVCVCCWMVVCGFCLFSCGWLGTSCLYGLLLDLYFHCCFFIYLFILIYYISKKLLMSWFLLFIKYLLFSFLFIILIYLFYIINKG